MALNWNWNEAWERLPKDESGNITDKDQGVNDTLIWATMALGLNEITEKNIGEWIVRAKMKAQCGYPIAQRYEGDNRRSAYIPTREELEIRIGLSTNATGLTRNQFKKKLIDRIETDADEN